MKKLLVLHVAALGKDLLHAHGVSEIAGMPVGALVPITPALTCVAQATLRTGMPPETHGMIANGRFFRETFESRFWCQSAKLVKGKRLWEDFRARGGRVGMYFFQQSLGECVDEVVSPAPIHTHGGGMMMATYQQPNDVLACQNPIPLWRYWGPLASPKVGRGIVSALVQRLQRGNAPELLFAYLPTLDYDLQRYGTHHSTTQKSVSELLRQLEQLIAVARQYGYQILLSGDYAITDVTGTVAFPNRALRAAGLFATRTIKGMRYPDFYQSRAFALCDHQTAHIYCLDPQAKAQTRKVLEALPEVDTIKDGLADIDFEITAKAGCWFAYPWWEHSSEAPDYASHVDIHNKPGFDPCELFFGRTPFTCSMDVNKVRGTHGRADAPVAYATDLPITPTTATELAVALQTWLGSDS